jgi:group II intron reverse transcriptase/maturase
MSRQALIEVILSRSNMERAWEQVKANRGAPGEDGVTLARWERNWEANIERLRQQVHTNTYCPNRPKRFLVSKKDGGMRELCRLTVSDKVLQRSVLNIIEKPFEQQFLDCAHGYRPKRSVATAVQQVVTHRDFGRLWVLDADIRACFDSLDHALLIERIRETISDWFVLNLTELWLKAGRKHRHQAVGVPMGAVLSPLWCNIYLHPMDVQLSAAGWKLVRYADDFIVLTHTQEEAQRAWQAVEQTLEGLKLELSASKTCLASFNEGFTFLGVTFEGQRLSYNWQQKRIEISGQNLKTLRQRPPDFYGR